MLRSTPFHAFRLAALAFALGLAWPTHECAAANIESEPALATAQLLPADTPLTGSGYRIATPTRLKGFLGQYRIDSDWGVLEAEGTELLRLRVAEMPALARLDGVTGSAVFADAIAQSLKRSGRSLVRVVTSPVETVKGIPAGLGRMLTRTAAGVRRTAQSVADAVSRERDDGASAAGAASGAPNSAKEVLGLNKARRSLARELGIDPYSSNPLLQQRLEDLAWAAMAGGVSIDIAVGALSGGAGQVLSVSGRLDNLVWELPPTEIRDRVERRLLARGLDATAVRGCLAAPAFTPTLQLRWADALDALGQPAGESGVLALCASVRGEVHMRFLIQQLEMQADASDPASELIALEQSIAARTKSGIYRVTLPVDHLSWTEALQQRDSAPSKRQLWIAGSVSRLAARELRRAGWQVQAGRGWPSQR